MPRPTAHRARPRAHLVEQQQPVRPTCSRSEGHRQRARGLACAACDPPPIHTHTNAPLAALCPAGPSSSLASASRICQPPLKALALRSQSVWAKPRPERTFAMRRSASSPPAAACAACAFASASAAAGAAEGGAAASAAVAEARLASAASRCVIRLRASSHTVRSEPDTAVCSR